MSFRGSFHKREKRKGSERVVGGRWRGREEGESREPAEFRVEGTPPSRCLDDTISTRPLGKTLTVPVYEERFQFQLDQRWGANLSSLGLSVVLPRKPFVSSRLLSNQGLGNVKQHEMRCVGVAKEENVEREEKQRETNEREREREAKRS